MEGDGLIYACDFCGNGMFLVDDVRALDEGVTCPVCGANLEGDDFVSIGFTIDGQTFFNIPGTGQSIHENELTRRERLMIMGVP